MEPAFYGRFHRLHASRSTELLQTRERGTRHQSTGAGVTLDGGDLADRLGRLHDDASRATPAFQSVLGAVLGVLDDVAHAEHGAAGAAISLAHRETMGVLVGEIRRTMDALRRLSTKPAPAWESTSAPRCESWWYALADATHSLESATGRLSTLVAVQPKGSAVRTLVREVIAVLRSHHRLLIGEAGRWIEG